VGFQCSVKLKSLRIVPIASCENIKYRKSPEVVLYRRTHNGYFQQIINKMPHF